jgi:hypothetical protein
VKNKWLFIDIERGKNGLVYSLSAGAEYSKPNRKERTMKKSLALVAGVAVLLAAATVRTMAAGDSVTITGEGKCAKCALKETKECQNVIQTEKNGKTVNYYLVANDVSKEFHGKLCKESKKVTATGTVKEVDGKLELTATKIELAAK